LECKGKNSATSNNMKLVHWLLMSGLLHLVQQRGAWAGCVRLQPYGIHRPTKQTGRTKARKIKLVSLTKYMLRQPVSRNKFL